MKNTSVGRTWENGPVEIHSFGGILLIFFFHFLLFPARSNPVLEEEESKILRESRFSSQGTQECGKDPAEDLLRMSWARAEPTQQGGQHGLRVCRAEVTPTDAETELRSPLNTLPRLKEWSLERCHSVMEDRL